MLGGIIYCVVVVVLLCVMWIGAYREWKRREANEEEATIYERFRKLNHDELEEYRYYEESFLIISRHAYNGKKRAFKCAYMIGYLNGKGETKHE